MGHLKRFQFPIMKKIIFLKNDSGFGLVETVLSLLLLALITSYSLYFISARLKVIFNANITNAINDEIRRDIEKLKSELWSDNFNPSSNENSESFYNTDITSCRNIYSRCSSFYRSNDDSIRILYTFIFSYMFLYVLIFSYMFLYSVFLNVVPYIFL